MFNFNGFTQKANNALNMAVDAAQDMGHTYVGTEHILLGLVSEESGVAASVLQQNGLSAEDLKDLIERTIGT